MLFLVKSFLGNFYRHLAFFLVTLQPVNVNFKQLSFLRRIEKLQNKKIYFTPDFKFSLQVHFLEIQISLRSCQCDPTGQFVKVLGDKF